MKNSDILKTINFLLNNNKLIVICTENGFTMGLQNSELKDCGTHKWAIRENDLSNFKLIR